MNKTEKHILSKAINNAIDETMLKCFIDMPQTLGLDIDEWHEYILSHILNRVKNNHDKYFTEKEDE